MLGSTGVWPRAAQRPWPITGALHLRHPGKLSVLKATSLGWMSNHGMSKHRPSVALELCWSWSPLWAICCCPLGVRLGPPLWCGTCALCGGMHQSQLMGLLRVKDTATPEVKFLDRCMIHCSEGVWQGSRIVAMSFCEPRSCRLQLSS